MNYVYYRLIIIKKLYKNVYKCKQMDNINFKIKYFFVYLLNKKKVIFIFLKTIRIDNV